MPSYSKLTIRFHGYNHQVRDFPLITPWMPLIFQRVDNETENLRVWERNLQNAKLQDGGQDHVCGGVETWKDNVISQTVEAW